MGCACSNEQSSPSEQNGDSKIQHNHELNHRSDVCDAESDEEVLETFLNTRHLRFLHLNNQRRLYRYIHRLGQRRRAAQRSRLLLKSRKNAKKTNNDIPSVAGTSNTNADDPYRLDATAMDLLMTPPPQTRRAPWLMSAPPCHNQQQQTVYEVADQKSYGIACAGHETSQRQWLPWGRPAYFDLDEYHRCF